MLSLSLLGLGLVGGAGVLGGCGVRLEDGAPPIPLVPTRRPIGSEDALLRLLADTRALALTARTAAVPVGRVLAPLHLVQASVLHDALWRLGVPSGALDATASASPTASESSPTGPASASSPTGPASPSILAAAEGRALTLLAQLRSVDTTLRPTVVSLLAQRYAAVTLLGASPDLGPAGGGTGLAGTAMSSLIGATREAIYRFQVVTAQLPPDARSSAGRSLTTLHALLEEQLSMAGDDPPPPSLGHPLPVLLGGPAQTRALAKRAASDLIGEFGRAVEPLTSRGDRGSVRATVGWLGRAVVIGRTWGVPLTPWPGLSPS